MLPCRSAWPLAGCCSLSTWHVVKRVGFSAASAAFLSLDGLARTFYPPKTNNSFATCTAAHMGVDVGCSCIEPIKACCAHMVMLRTHAMQPTTSLLLLHAAVCYMGTKPFASRVMTGRVGLHARHVLAGRQGPGRSVPRTEMGKGCAHPGRGTASRQVARSVVPKIWLCSHPTRKLALASCGVKLAGPRPRSRPGPGLARPIKHAFAQARIL